MERRELIKWIVAVTGSAFVGVEPLLAAAAPATGAYSAADVALLDEIAETILPRTDTPGAKDAKVGAFIARYSAACYKPEELAALRAGLPALEAAMHRRHGRSFMHATPAQRQAMLVEIDRDAKQAAKAAQGKTPHWFTLCKQLTLYGFFSSEPGATKVARDRPIPGEYHGCIPYHQGETFWS